MTWAARPEAAVRLGCSRLPSTRMRSGASTCATCWLGARPNRPRPEEPLSGAALARVPVPCRTCRPYLRKSARRRVGASRSIDPRAAICDHRCEGNVGRLVVGDPVEAAAAEPILPAVEAREQKSGTQGNYCFGEREVMAAGAGRWPSSWPWRPPTCRWIGGFRKGVFECPTPTRLQRSRR